MKNYLKTCDKVYHTTLDPNKPGVVRVHLVPPKKLKLGIPWVVILNGYSVLPLQTSWAILLKEFIEVLNNSNVKAIGDGFLKKIVLSTVTAVQKIFPKVEKKTLENDLTDIVLTLKDVAYGEEPSSEIGYMSLGKYAKFMSAPHRMDLMISAMEKNSKWNCNQKCLHCYACGEKMSNVEELDTNSFKIIIDKCKEAHIPALTFTGGEPTIRQDLVELVNHASWFVTRLNTNGILLSKKLCEELYKASLDSVQVTLYSYDAKIHNTLVGGNHFDETIQGIKNAIASGLDVSINTPLCSINRDYVKTIKFANNLGIRYFSSSGIIPSGNAKTSDSEITALTNEEITNIIKDAFKYAEPKDLELSFTSPGWIKDSVLKEMNMVVPSCGACLSNMAVAPNGTVIPCQSWLFEDGLGNMLTDKFDNIWKSSKCKNIRKQSSKMQEICLLRKSGVK